MNGVCMLCYHRSQSVVDIAQPFERPWLFAQQLERPCLFAEQCSQLLQRRLRSSIWIDMDFESARKPKDALRLRDAGVAGTMLRHAPSRNYPHASAARMGISCSGRSSPDHTKSLSHTGSQKSITISAYHGKRSSGVRATFVLHY